MPTRRPIPPRAGRTVWAFLGFLLLFVLLILLVSHFYLLPALAAYPHVSPAWRRKMSADALLLCVLLLVILLCGLMLTVRIGRFFFPRPTAPRTRTRHVDAWAEAGRRASEAPQDVEEDDEEADG